MRRRRPDARPPGATPASLRPADLVGLGLVGLRTRPGRAALTAVGIAVGVAALVSVAGISSSSRAHLLAEIDRLGTDVLEVSPGRRITGERSVLPVASTAMVRRIPGVQAAAAVSAVDATVRRTDHIPGHITGGIAVAAADPELLDATRSRLRTGRFLTGAGSQLPVVVLGDAAARRLGIHDLGGQPVVWLGGRWFAVIGVLRPNPIAAALDRTALIGTGAARASFDPHLTPTTVFVRTSPHDVDRVRGALAAAAKPEAPSEVEVVRAADALYARAAAEGTLDTLLLGLAAVALVVGAIGMVNTMVIGVLERRAEIGLRRALGATGRHVAAQFVLEAAALGLMGGTGGVAAGSAVTAVYAAARGAPPGLGVATLAGGVTLAVGVAVVAGIHPAARAARLSPADALRTS